MSVIVMTRFDAKATALEHVIQNGHAATLEGISAEGRAKGCLHHMFIEDTDGSLMVIDEWESEQAFHDFFAQQEDIRTVAAAAGVTAPPTSTAYRILDTPDRF